MIQIDMLMPTQCDCCRFCLTEYTDDNKPDSYAYCCVAERFIAQSNDGTDKVVSIAIIKKQQWCPLKEQEPVEPIPTEDDDWICGACNNSVVGTEELDEGGFAPIRFNYCPNCGRKVKWE